MQTYERWLREDAWQDVVDGELSQAELRELVAACQAHPELWRCCAIAFLEEQALRTEFQRLEGQWPLNEASQAHSLSQRTPFFQLNQLGQQPGQEPGQQLGSTSPSARRGLEEAVARDSSSASSVSANSSSLISTSASSRSVILGEAIARASLKANGSEANSSEANGSEADSSEANKVAQKHRLAAKQSVGHSALLNNLALAATIMLAFVIGWQASRRLSGTAPELQAVGQMSSGRGERSHLANRHDRSLDNETRGQLVATSARDAIEYALERPESAVPFDRNLPQPLAELERRGLIDIKSTDGFVPVRLSDGNAAILPFHRYEVQARNAY